MLQPTGHLGFAHEPFPMRFILDMPRLSFLERDLPIQFLIEGQEHLANPAARVRSQHAEPIGAGRGSALVRCARPL